MIRYAALTLCLVVTTSATAAPPPPHTTPTPRPGLQATPGARLVSGHRALCLRLDSELRCWSPSEAHTHAGGQPVAIGEGRWCRAEADAVACYAGSPASPEPDAELERWALTDAVLMAAGASHVCVRRDSGRVHCLGDDTHGQLGGASLERAVPELEGVTRLAAAADHSCAIDGDGALWCWGLHWHRHQGRDAGLAPARVPLGGEALEIATTPSHTCALRVDGAVLCWGRSVAGELGDATRIDRQEPTPVRALPPDVTRLALGMEHSCALTAAGEVACWGSHAHGQLGDGAPAHEGRLIAAPVALPAPATDIAASAYATCATLEGGAVTCWGAAHDPTRAIHLTHLRQRLQAALAYPSRHIEENLIAPEPWAALGLEDTQAFSLGAEHACALRGAGEVVCWGHNDERQLADGTTIDRNAPHPPEGLPACVDVAVSADHSCAVGASGEAWCWGHGWEGQLGNGTRKRGKKVMPVSDLDDARAISASARHSCALREGGRVSCWGANDAGQLGLGDTRERLSPRRVPGLSEATRIVAGKRHTCALVEGGAVWCWGDNRHGQLGPAASDTHATEPAQVEGLEGVRELVRGRLDDTCALRGAGDALCWGAGWSGLEALPLSGVESLAMSPRHACAALAGGRVVCWGDNDAGQLGDGTMIARSEPTPVLGLEDATQVQVGLDFSCALREDGQTLCWGSNQRGQIGAGR